MHPAICCCTPHCRCHSRSWAQRLFAGVVAVGVAWVCTLATGVSFSMLTLAFAQLLYASRSNGRRSPARSDGLAGIPRTAGPFGLTALQTKYGYYESGAGLPCWRPTCFAGPWWVRRSARCCAASARTKRRRSRWATTRGVYKIAVVAISFALGGLAGALYSPFAGFANTELLFWLFSGQVLIMVIVGGQGTLLGPDPRRGVLHAAAA